MYRNENFITVEVYTNKGLLLWKGDMDKRVWSDAYDWSMSILASNPFIRNVPADLRVMTEDGDVW